MSRWHFSTGCLCGVLVPGRILGHPSRKSGNNLQRLSIMGLSLKGRRLCAPSQSERSAGPFDEARFTIGRHPLTTELNDHGTLF